LALYQHGGAHWLLVPGAALAAVAVLAALTLDIPAAGAQPVDSRTLEETAGVTKRGGILGRLIKGYGYDRSWTGLLIANGLNGVYFGGISAYLPLFMHAIHGPNAGIFFTADAVGVLLLRWPAGILADRTRPLVPITLGILITLAGLAAFIPAQSVITLALAGAGTGIGAGLFANGLLTDLTQRSTSANRGTAMSLSFLTPGLGVFIGAGFSGALYGPGGFGAIILFGALAEAVGLPVLLLAHRRPKAEYLPAR
jgi:MFS family permease